MSSRSPRATTRASRLVALLLVVLALVASACSSDADSDSSASDDEAGSETTTEPDGDAGADVAAEVEVGADRGGGVVDLDAELAEASFEVNEGVGSVTVTGADPGARLTLLDAGGARIVTGGADDAGQLHVAYVPDEYLETEGGMQDGVPTTDGGSLQPGEYRVYDEDAAAVSGPVTVLAVDDVPEDASFYQQDLSSACPDLLETRRCYTYIEARDGVQLSAMIRLPDAQLWGEPPYPTLIEYSGYGPSRPEGNGEPGSMIATLLGYATVGVNMRGTGCSGGVFDTFNPAQHADGYDIVETVANEPWVLHGEPGMVGLSYSGISQLFTASTQPPHLAAITPLSVIEDPWLQQWPGGIYNQGFTKNWLEERDRQNSPDGDSWVAAQIEGGDEVCEANLVLRSQSVDFEAFGHALEFRPPDSDDRRLALLVQDIDVPVYLTGAWQDEQTGSKFATMIDRFTSVPDLHVTMFNGHHPDGYSPMVLTRWYEFLEFYVAQRTPDLPDIVEAASPAVLEENFGIPVGLGPDRFAGMDYEEALADYQAEPDVRILFESGWGLPDYPGGTGETFEASFDAWPAPSAEAVTWYLGPDGTLVGNAPADAAPESFRFDPESGETTYTDAGAYDFQFPEIPFAWPAPAEGDAVVHVSEPVAEDTVVAGPGYATLWVRSDVDDVTLEVTLSEVREDGVEYRIQGGWLRVGHQVLDEDLSDEFRIEPTYVEDDFEAPVPGEWVQVQVPIYPFAHLLRAGSSLALRVDTPGRDTPFWAFENPTYEGADEVWHDIGVGGDQASSVTIQTLPDVEVPAEVIASPPPCPSLRGQVCREWEPSENTPAED